MVTAFHTTKRGASHGIAFLVADDLEAHLKKMKQEVRVMCRGEQVGGVWKNEGRWVWWYDSSVFEQVNPGGKSV